MTTRTYFLACLCFLCLIATKYSAQTGFTGLIRFGDQFHERALPAVRLLPVKVFAGTPGYDGQFYAQVALDPLLRSSEIGPALDNPGYRARRILLSATAALIGLGNPWWTLQAYALLNVICWLWLGWLLRELVGLPGLLGTARWLGCMLSVGVMDCVSRSLVDLAAVTLTAFAIRELAEKRTRSGMLGFALGVLARETALFGAGCVLLRPKNPLRSLWQILLVALPLGAWSWYVFTRFDGSDSSGLGNFTWPFIGMFREARLSIAELAAGHWDTRYVFALLAVPGLLVQAAVLATNPDRENPWWRVGIAYAVVLLCLSSWVWSGYWAACRAVLPMTIAFNLLLPADRKFWLLWVAGNLTMLHAVWRFL